MDQANVHDLVKSDPERAWPVIVQLIKDGSDPIAALDRLEDLIYEHADRFIARIRTEAHADPLFRGVVVEAHVGGFSSAGVDEFRRFQEELGTSY
jgi:hypothetical protein